jgi:hypothetical protein
MPAKIFIIAASLLAFIASFTLRDRLLSPESAPAREMKDCRRIISMAPSITETLFALGLGDTRESAILSLPVGIL